MPAEPEGLWTCSYTLGAAISLRLGHPVRSYIFRSPYVQSELPSPWRTATVSTRARYFAGRSRPPAARCLRGDRSDGRLIMSGRKREECVLRFFEFLHQYEKFVHSVVTFLNDYMREASSSFRYEASERLFKSKRLFTNSRSASVRNCEEQRPKDHADKSL